jgi:hypothetical protein
VQEDCLSPGAGQGHVESPGIEKEVFDSRDEGSPGGREGDNDDFPFLSLKTLHRVGHEILDRPGRKFGTGAEKSTDQGGLRAERGHDGDFGGGQSAAQEIQKESENRFRLSG